MSSRMEESSGSPGNERKDDSGNLKEGWGGGHTSPGSGWYQPGEWCLFFLQKACHTLPWAKFPLKPWEMGVGGILAR